MPSCLRIRRASPQRPPPVVPVLPVEPVPVVPPEPSPRPELDELYVPEPPPARPDIPARAPEPAPEEPVLDIAASEELAVGVPEIGAPAGTSAVPPVDIPDEPIVPEEPEDEADEEVEPVPPDAEPLSVLSVVALAPVADPAPFVPVPPVLPPAVLLSSREQPGRQIKPISRLMPAVNRWCFIELFPSKISGSSRHPYPSFQVVIAPACIRQTEIV